MAATLSEYLLVNRPGGFRAVPQYFPSGDYLTYFVRDARHYAKRLDDVVTVYLEMGTNGLVGCKVKGVKHILRKAGRFGVRVDGTDGGPVRLGLLFFVGAAPDRADGERNVKYYDLLEEFAHVDFCPPSLAG